MCAYTHLKQPQPTMYTETEKSEPLEQEEPKYRSRFTRFIYTSLISLYRNDTSLLEGSSSNIGVNFVSRKSKIPKYCVTGITVVDPGTEEEWVAVMPVDVDATCITTVKDFFTGKKGVFLPHAHPRSFVLQPTRKVSRLNLFLNFSYYTVAGKLSHWIRLFYYRHMLFDHNHEFFFNLTLIEKRLVAFSGIFLAFFLDSLYQGFSNNAFYFITRLDEASSVIRYILSTTPKYSRVVVAVASFFFMFILLLSLQILSGKWIRKVQDKTSYWQGLQLIRTCLFLIKCALIECCHSCYKRAFQLSDESEDYKSGSEITFLEPEGPTKSDSTFISAPLPEDEAGVLEMTPFLQDKLDEKGVSTIVSYLTNKHNIINWLLLLE